MCRAVPLIALLLATAALAEEAVPSNPTLVFYNARLALRDGKPEEVLRLWLLRNSLAQRGERTHHDEEFRSVVWAALGELGLCQDGFPRDDQGGAGLWPLAFHNWLVQALSRGPPPPTSAPWDTFGVGRQQRFISLHDVLSAEELRSVSFFRSRCLLPHLTLSELGQSPWIDLEDRLSVGLLMRELLARSRTTLARQRVQGVAAVEARIFDLDLALAELQVRRARREGRAAFQEARGVGMSEAGASELRRGIEAGASESKQAAFLRQTLRWSPSEWLSLGRQRRLALFAQARPLSKDPEARARLVLGVIDELIERRMGDEVESWVGFLDAADAPSLRSALTSGERGRRLLELEPSTGFRERPVIALHRGVGYLESGALQDALRSFAYALQHAEESRQPDVTQALARRWLSYVLSRFETSEEVVATLEELVPRREYNAVVEDLVWRAALRADRASFDRVTANIQRGGAFEARISRLRPLAEGKPGEMATQLRDAAQDEPHAVLQFVRQLLERVEAEDGDVRRANAVTLKLLRGVLEPLAAGGGAKRNARSRTAEALIGRAQAILEGLSELDLSEGGRARATSPRRVAFAGVIRLAPADPLPWPFRAPQAEVPSAFAPLSLVPVEWRDANGSLVFGWRISE